MTLRLPRRAAAALFMLLLMTGPATADFASATRAYDGGDFAAAFHEWRMLAEDSDTAAQVAIAGMHRDGVGRAINLARAVHWYGLAARAGDAVAQMNLAEMYQHGWGVARDIVAAFVWYDRSARQGRRWAAEQRDRLASRMTAPELATARERRLRSK